LQETQKSESMGKDRSQSKSDRGAGENLGERDPILIELAEADTPEKIEKVREIFQRYARSLDFDLAFQGFAAELAGLPGDYSPPAGRLLLALEKGEIAGCAALRKIDGDICEMKRLFVTREHRRKGVGRILAEAIIREARTIGYKRMRLDTVPSMTPATGLYRSLGFEETPPYCHNPVPGAKFFELRLEPKGSHP
jgi:putative acetyltransferase